MLINSLAKQQPTMIMSKRNYTANMLPAIAEG